MALLLLLLAGCEAAVLPRTPGRADASTRADAAAAIDSGAPAADAGESPPADGGLDAPPPRPVDGGPPRVGPNECPAEPQPDTFETTVPPDPGPIVRYTVRPYYTLAPDGVTVRDPVLTGDVLAGGVWLVPLGDVLVADSFQKNAANRLCQWIDYPTWTLDDPYCALRRLPIRNPFLLRAATEHLTTGDELTIAARIDGVDSNVVPIRVVPPP